MEVGTPLQTIGSLKSIYSEFINSNTFMLSRSSYVATGLLRAKSSGSKPFIATPLVNRACRASLTVHRVHACLTYTGRQTNL